MKRNYDIVGFGEGLSGLLASALLANKGFSCLWIDTSPQDEGGFLGLPALMGADFWSAGLRPLLTGVDAQIPAALGARKARSVQSLVPGRRVDLQSHAAAVDPDRLRRERERCRRLVGRAVTRPFELFRHARCKAPQIEPWEENMVRGLSGNGSLNRLTYHYARAALAGMGTIDYGALREALGAYLPQARGDYVHIKGVELLEKGDEVLGLRFGDQIMKARYYLGEQAPGRREAEAFRFYGCYTLDPAVIPAAMGDVVFVSPPPELIHPLVMVMRNSAEAATLWISTLVRRDHTLTSVTELVSWAGEMVLRRMREVIPFVDEYLIESRVVDPAEDGTIRPWFECDLSPQQPALFSRRKYIKPLDRMYVCARARLPWLDLEGEVVWGICLANAILKDLNRSDLIGLKTG